MIASGMFVGTLFTLFVLPTFYLVIGGRKKIRTVRELGAAIDGSNIRPSEV